MSLVEEMERLDALRRSGALSEAEYQQAKEQLLAGNPSVGQQFKKAVDGVSSDENMWGLFIHLSQFAGYLIPFAGLVVPIVLWQVKKNDSAKIDQHGCIVVNWIISELIYGVVCGLLCMVLIGIPLLFGLMLASLIFPIVGAVKANNGEVWVYPFSLTFFRPEHG